MWFDQAHHPEPVEGESKDTAGFKLKSPELERARAFLFQYTIDRIILHLTISSALD